MGVRNFLIEGVSGAGKTTVAEELRRRGRHVIHGDRELAFLGDPKTGEAAAWHGGETATDSARWRHAHWIWDVHKVNAIVADRSHAQSFFCGGARNHHDFIGLFDVVFVLDIDADTLSRRLAERRADEFGGAVAEQELIAHLHATKQDLPKIALNIDATQSLARVVDEILSKCGEADEALH